MNFKIKMNVATGKNRSIKGQSMLDYVILLAIVVATLVVMGYYIRNSYAGKWREVSDSISKGEVYVPNIEGVAQPSTITFNVNTPTP